MSGPKHRGERRQNDRWCHVSLASWRQAQPQHAVGTAFKVKAEIGIRRVCCQNEGWKRRQCAKAASLALASIAARPSSHPCEPSKHSLHHARLFSAVQAGFGLPSLAMPLHPSQGGLSLAFPLLEAGKDSSAMRMAVNSYGLFGDAILALCLLPICQWQLASSSSLMASSITSSSAQKV